MCSFKKLNYKYYGPFEIKELVKKQVYRLKLLKKMKIHNVFYVSLLEPYTKTNNSDVPTLPSIMVKGEDKYEIEKILNSQIH